MGQFLERSPLVAPAIALCVGIWVGRYVALHPAIAILTGLLMVGIAAVMLRRHRSLCRAFLWAAIAILGLGWFNYSLQMPADPLPDWLDKAKVRGEITGFPVTFAGKTKVKLNDCMVEYEGQTWSIGYSMMLTIRADREKLWPISDLKHGELIEAKARIKRPNSRRNPGGFDAREYWQRRGVLRLAYCSEANLTRLGNDGGLWSGAVNVLLGVRRGFKGLLDETCNPGRSPIMAALVLGDRTGITSDHRDQLQRLGIAHIIAISGLHIGFVAFFFYRVFRELLLHLGILARGASGRRVICLVTIVPVLAYALIAGPRHSTIRAVIMVCAYLIAMAFDRHRETMNIIALAAIAILLWMPGSLFEAGFQLSFAAVIAVSEAIRYLSARRRYLEQRRIQRYVIGLAVASAAATLATAPICAYWFGRVSLIAVIANVLVIPTAMVLVNLLFFSLFVFLINAWVSSVLLSLADWVTWVMQATMDVIDKAPYSSLIVPTPGLFTCLMFFVSLLLVSALVLRLKNQEWGADEENERMRTRLRKAAILSIGLLIASVVIGARWSPDGELRAAFLDVGRGFCCVIEAPGGKTVLVDGGGSRYSDTGAGKNVIVPYLRRRGIDRIDYAVLTNPSGEHIDGLLDLFSEAGSKALGRLEIGQLMIGDSKSESRKFRKLMDWAKRLSVPISHIGDKFPDETRLQIRRPCERSLVFKLEFEDFSILFLSEAGPLAQLLLTEHGASLKSTVLVIPVRGWSSSEGKHQKDILPEERAFLELVSPSAIIASGIGPAILKKDKPRAFPYTIDAFKVYMTNELHCVIVESNGRDWRVIAPFAEGEKGER
ncbi:ComEC/Rec2 family competence protein [bacterium]|nr:ComEC/Rec2 family competence protein [bacterium]